MHGLAFVNPFVATQFRDVILENLPSSSRNAHELIWNECKNSTYSRVRESVANVVKGTGITLFPLFSTDLRRAYCTHLTMSTTQSSNHFRHSTTLPYKIPERDLSEWNIFVALASRGTPEEKSELGLPESFEFTSTKDQTLKDHFKDRSEGAKTYLQQRVKDENQKRSAKPSNPDDRAKLAKSLKDELCALLHQMKEKLDTDAAVTLNSDHPEDWDNEMAYHNSEHNGRSGKICRCLQVVMLYFDAVIADIESMRHENGARSAKSGRCSNATMESVGIMMRNLYSKWS
ncbi:hypothetical protein BDB00DRAFT_843988 [Zychaea mexicana]|uniref:uncharacterized protein n=1 Tax=Zychaea mexicana TaxID=64656 RepID=UPI0022FF053E|nr:uncharacterized protein BDB00DRAFT_843988 [Zychaea mexicana]KAI9489266.1 hypothetical protein BDB00DRAFT_843988 [Zychaea mexicana]